MKETVQWTHEDFVVFLTGVLREKNMLPAETGNITLLFRKNTKPESVLVDVDRIIVSFTKEEDHPEYTDS